MIAKIAWAGVLLLFLESMALSAEMRVETAVKEVELRGYTRSIKTATLSAEVSGKTTSVNYEVGDTIRKKPFASIDTTFIDYDIANTRVAVEKINTRLQKIESRVAYLANEYQRKEALFAKGRATEVIRDAASQELEQARLEETAVRQEKASLEIQLRQLQEKKERHDVSAPLDWVVTRKMVEVGEIVQAGMPLAVVQDFRRLLVPLTVSNDELNAIRRKGKRFDARLEDRTIAASVYYVNPEFNEQTRKIDIRLMVHADAGERRGGLRFVLPVMVESRGLRIPAAALVNRYENPKVFAKDQQSPVPVTILDASDQYVTVAADPRLPIGTLLADPKGR